MTTIRVSNSLDPDQDRHSVGLHLGSNCLQKALTKLPTGMQRVITGKYFSVQYISHIGIYMHMYYHKYSDTLNTFNMLCPLNKAKVISKGSSKNQFDFPMLNGTLSFLQKYLFLLLSFQFCIIYGTCSPKCTGNF